MTPAELVSRARVIATGTVVSAPPPPRDPGGGRFVTVQAERYYKGRLGAALSIWHNENVGPDIRFEPGRRYLFFLRSVDGVWRTSLCDGTREVPAGIPVELQAALGEGVAPDPKVVNGPTPTQNTPATGANAWGWPVAIAAAAIALCAYAFAAWRKSRKAGAGRR